jgi:hypothetical protein
VISAASDVGWLVFSQKSLDGARGIESVIPDPMLVAIAIENHRPLTELLFQAVGVQLSLPLTDPRVAAGAFGLYETERLTVVTQST